MAFQRPFLISLRREDSREPWGFRLDGGGVTDRPVTVQQILERSLAERSGLHEGDQVIQIGRINVQGKTLSEVQELIITCKNRVEMFIIREDLLRNRKENEPLTVKAVVHSPYNSPFQLYSQDNVADTLATQACILSDPTIQPNHLGPKSPPTVIHSNVLQALREQGEKGPRLNGEVVPPHPPIRKKQPPPVPPKPRSPIIHPASRRPVKASIFRPGNMEQVQYQNFSSVQREEKRTTTQRTSNYEEYEEEEEETEEEEEEEPVVVTQTTKTFKSQTSFTPQQPDIERSQHQTQQIVRTQQTIQQETRQREFQQQQQQQQLEQQRRAEIARQQQQQAYEQQQRQLREQQQREAHEQQQRQIREQQAREQQAREQRLREQQARDQQAREQQARAREQQLREQQAREQQQRQAAQQRQAYEQQQAQQRQAYEQQQAREAYERQQRQAQLQAQQRRAQEAYEQQQRQPQYRAQPAQQQQQQQQRQPAYHDTEGQRKLTSTARVVPANLGSPTTQRRGCCPSWPPKNSSVRELPKTGFSPSFVQERGTKQFVWPPPKPEDMMVPHEAVPHVHGHAGEAWHPQETPVVARPLVPRSPTPTRRLGDSVWPPRHTLVQENNIDSRPMPRPVCRRGKFDDYISHASSSNVPPTYRLPPGTIHVVY